MRSGSDELSSYLAGDLAVGVRTSSGTRPLHSLVARSSAASSSTTSDDAAAAIAAGAGPDAVGGLVGPRGTRIMGGAYATASPLPVTSIRQPPSGLILTHSSLSLSSTTDRAASRTRFSQDGIALDAAATTADAADAAGAGLTTGEASSSPNVNNNNNNNSNNNSNVAVSRAAAAPGGESDDIENSPPPPPPPPPPSVSSGVGDYYTSGGGALSSSTTSVDRMIRSPSGGAASHYTTQSAVSDSWGFFEDHDHLVGGGAAGGGGGGGETPGNSTGDLRRKGISVVDRGGQRSLHPASAGGSGASGQGGGGGGGGGGAEGGRITTSSTGGGASSTGNNTGAGAAGERGRGSSGGGGGGGGGNKKRGAMPQFSDVIMAQPVPLLSPPRAEPSADAVTAPTYVLEESLSSQNLWKHTAGNRPPQPAEEREFYERLWAENFSKSQVEYEMPPEVLTATTPIFLSPFADGRDDGAGGSHAAGACGTDYALVGAHDGAAGAAGGEGGGIGSVGGPSSIGPSKMLGAGAAQHYHLTQTGDSELGPHRPHHTVVNRTIHEKDGELLIVCKGDNVFGTTVSKSFETVVGSGSKVRTESVGVSVSVASYRVVECQREKGKQYAQFHVVYCEGSFRDTVGVWRRYSDFKELSRRVMHGHGEGCGTALQGMHPMSVTEEAETELLPNAITSWRLLKKRQRWFRCLDAGYLSLKVFLLERFLHDILFESSTPDILRDFVGVDRKQ